MKKIITVIAVLALSLLSGNARADEPLRITIFGDSYSTFEGYLTPSDNLSWYFPPEHPDKKENNDVEKVEQTWWYQLIDRMGAKLEMNNSYSGSPIGYMGYIRKPGTPREDYKDRSFITRAPNLGNPDLILLCGGTNDNWTGQKIGEYKYADWEEQDFYTFRPAMARLCEDLNRMYPDARIVFILNCDLRDELNDSVHYLCYRYRLECLDLHDIEKQNNHPSVKGMRQIADQVYDYLNQ